MQMPAFFQSIDESKEVTQLLAQPELRILFVFIGSLVWTVLFIIVKTTAVFPQLSFKNEKDIQNRIVSLIHCLFTLCYSALYLSKYGYDYPQENSNMDNIVIIISVSYFIYDFFCMIQYDLHDFYIVMHHAVVVWGQLDIMINLKFAGESIIALYYAEISNPSMQMRSILKSLGKKGTKMYEIVELSFMFIFAYFRIAFLPFYFNKMLVNQYSPISFKVVATIVLLLSFMWIRTIMIMLRNKIKRFYISFSKRKEFVVQQRQVEEEKKNDRGNKQFRSQKAKKVIKVIESSFRASEAI